MRYSFFEKTDVGMVRKANEDSIGSQDTPWGKIVVLCDGMGGHRGGATASGIAVKCILEFLAANDISSEVEALETAVTFANEQIYATALNDPDLRGMGTTCVVLLVKGDNIWIAHVGDSRAYLYSGNRLHRLTRDHSFVQGLVDSGAISEEEAESHPRKNELLSALGIRPEVKVEVTPEPILPATGDLFLVCSDGLNGMINDRQIAHLIEHYLMIDMLGEQLIEAAKNAGGTDNISVQLIKVIESVHRNSRFTPILPPLHHRTTDPQGQSVPKELDSPGSRSALRKYGVIGFFVLIVMLLLVKLLGGGEKEMTMAQVQEATAKRIVKVVTLKLENGDKPCETLLLKSLKEGKCVSDSTFDVNCILNSWREFPECGGEAPAPPEIDPAAAAKPTPDDGKGNARNGKSKKDRGVKAETKKENSDTSAPKNGPINSK